MGRQQQQERQLAVWLDIQQETLAVPAATVAVVQRCAAKVAVE